MDETYTHLPLHLSPSTKELTCPTDATLTPTLSSLHTLHRALLPLPTQTPPPPLPTNPKRTAQVQKMREQGNASLKAPSSKTPTHTQALEAIKLYTYGIEMALGRPAWEPAALVREEASVLFANRAQAYMVAGMWAEGAADAETSVWLRRGGNGKAWWRRGRCLVEMGRWGEAREWVGEGMGVEGNEGELGGLGREVERYFAERGEA